MCEAQGIVAKPFSRESTMFYGTYCVKVERRERNAVFILNGIL